MRRVGAVEELEMEGTGCVAVNLAAGAGLHCHLNAKFLTWSGYVELRLC